MRSSFCLLYVVVFGQCSLSIGVAFVFVLVSCDVFVLDCCILLCLASVRVPFALFCVCIGLLCVVRCVCYILSCLASVRFPLALFCVCICFM